MLGTPDACSWSVLGRTGSSQATVGCSLEAEWRKCLVLGPRWGGGVTWSSIPCSSAGLRTGACFLGRKLGAVFWPRKVSEQDTAKTR